MSTEVHQAAETVTTSNELDVLFGPLFDEYFNGENQVVLKSSAVTTTDASNKRQQQPDSTSSTSTLATTVTANGNFYFVLEMRLGDSQRYQLTSHPRWLILNRSAVASSIDSKTKVHNESRAKKEIKRLDTVLHALIPAKSDSLTTAHTQAFKVNHSTSNRTGITKKERKTSQNDKMDSEMVLWIQNQMLDYGFNFMNTKIYIDNESTICIVKNLVFHSKTKHIEIRHHFIRDSYEKKLIHVIKIHTDHNVADLLTNDISRKAKRTTEISQSSGPIPLVIDETVIKEWEDIMERAATTVSSLEAEQDSGNINRTQSMATLNESFPQGANSGSGPRCQDTIFGGAEAQTRFEAASK
ncbi:hypothetical protein Tco_1235566 [Tanacetum coccineum]